MQDLTPCFSGRGEIVARAVIGGISAELGGGKFANGAATAAFGYLMNDAWGSDQPSLADKREALLAQQREALAVAAENDVGRTDWNQSETKAPLSAGDNKCNLFVYDKLVQVGIPAPTRTGMFSGETGPLGAGNWENQIKMPGWSVVTSPQRGDIVADGGHVGIMVRPGYTVSATLTKGVVRNDWGFRSDNTPTFRRWTGTSK